MATKAVALHAQKLFLTVLRSCSSRHTEVIHTSLFTGPAKSSHCLATMICLRMIVQDSGTMRSKSYNDF